MTITMHAIPHSGTRNEGTEPRANMIWRIRAKQRQPNFVHNGATDHADRLGPSGINGELSHTTSQRLLWIDRFSASCLDLDSS